MKDWWYGDPGERYWVEITAREDIGADLHAPAANEKAGSFWSYDLVRAPLPGDLVYHYDSRKQAIIGYSQIVGMPWSDRIVWAAQGTSARKQGIVPHLRDGVRRGLGGFSPLAVPVTKAMLLERREALFAVRDAVSKPPVPTRFPFIPYGKTDVRAIQGYLTKLPKALLTIFPELVAVPAQESEPVEQGNPIFGGAYRRANEELAVSVRDPFEVDPALVERALRGHARAQNLLAAHVASRGGTPLSPVAGGPNFDLAWELDSEVWVAEVKSCTTRNQENQLRLGLGQVLRYRSLLSRTLGAPVRALLMVERKPVDPFWMDLCHDVGVDLKWPEALHGPLQ